MAYNAFRAMAKAGQATEFCRKYAVTITCNFEVAFYGDGVAPSCAWLGATACSFSWTFGELARIPASCTTRAAYLVMRSHRVLLWRQQLPLASWRPGSPRSDGSGRGTLSGDLDLVLLYIARARIAAPMGSLQEKRERVFSW